MYGDINGEVQTVPYNEPILGNPQLMPNEGLIPSNIQTIEPVLEGTPAPELPPLSNVKTDTTVRVVSYEEDAAVSQSTGTRKSTPKPIPNNPVRINWSKVGADQTHSGKTKTTATIGRIVTKNDGDK
jgi:hypothetical protein